MPLTGGTLRPAEAEAMRRRHREELQATLRGMEARYNRYIYAGTSHHPEARYLKQCIKDLKRQLRG